MRKPNWLRAPEKKRIFIPYLKRFWYSCDCKSENKFIRALDVSKCKLNNEKRQEKIIVSLTTFPKRVNIVKYAIESLMIQTVLPDRIVLWLSKEQFSEQIIPQTLAELVERGLEVRFVDDDLKSHKKYIYALQQQKEDEVVITYDDDLIYEKNSIEKLVTLHNKFPNSIICNRAHEVKHNNIDIFPYSSWSVRSNEGVKKPSHKLIPSTGNGCLYPYNCMRKETFDEKLIKNYAFSADDIWIGVNSFLSGTKIVRTKKTIATLVPIAGSQEEALTNFNDLQGGNEMVIQALFKLFPEYKRRMMGNE